MTTFNPLAGVSFKTSVNKVYRTLENDFGDGYTQTTGDGINNVLEVWNVIWDKITDVQADEIEAFLDARAGAPFYWVTPKGNTKVFVSGQPARTYEDYNNNSISVTFTERPGIPT